MATKGRESGLMSEVVKIGVYHRDLKTPVQAKCFFPFDRIE